MKQSLFMKLVELVLALVVVVANILQRIIIPAIIILSLCKITMNTYSFSWGFTIFMPMVIGIIGLFVQAIITAILKKYFL